MTYNCKKKGLFHINTIFKRETNSINTNDICYAIKNIHLCYIVRNYSCVERRDNTLSELKIGEEIVIKKKRKCANLQQSRICVIESNKD